MNIWTSYSHLNFLLALTNTENAWHSCSRKTVLQYVHSPRKNSQRFYAEISAETFFSDRKISPRFYGWHNEAIISCVFRSRVAIPASGNMTQQYALGDQVHSKLFFSVQISRIMSLRYFYPWVRVDSRMPTSSVFVKKLQLKNLNDKRWWNSCPMIISMSQSQMRNKKIKETKFRRWEIRKWRIIGFQIFVLYIPKFFTIKEFFILRVFHPTISN